jgi:hypothetical protein
MYWCNYHYEMLPMSIKIAVNVFQEGVNELFSDLDHAHLYLDDVLLVDNVSLEDHMAVKSERMLGMS